MAGRRSWSMRVSIATLVCCAAVAVASADLVVDPEAELPHVEGPAELQVVELRTFTPEQQARFFHEARLALNVTDVGSEAVTFASGYDLSKGPWGQNLGWALHRGTASLFARLPKCANNAIRLMLFAQYGGSNLSLGEMWDKAGNVERDSFSPTKRFNFFEDKINQRNSGVIEVKGIQWDKRQLPPGGSFKPVVSRAWTFVRDPLSHFVSGFTEAATRRHKREINEMLQGGKPVAPFTIDRFISVLEQLVTGDFRSFMGQESYHVYPMSEQLALIQPQVAVGRMAQLEEHWKAMQTWLGQEQVIPWNRSIAVFAAHPSSRDLLGTTAAAKTAISKNPAVQRALCFLLLSDFINLGYTLPPECKEDKRMTALLEWLDGPKEMVKAASQEAGPRPTVEELDWMFQSVRTFTAEQRHKQKRRQAARKQSQRHRKQNPKKKGKRRKANALASFAGEFANRRKRGK